jgi:nitroimidazol reductase NimA-like FMN-containing flavoprotein (pyridoxamine 5'-phosphate oxidase superfamily)
MNRGEVDSLLAQSPIGRLSMCGRDGWPYTIPLPFCWLDGSLYLRLRPTGRKGRVLAENDRVCFEVDEFTDTLDEYASVLVEGRLLEVWNLDEKRRVKQTNDQKYRELRNGYRPGHGRCTPLEALPLRKIVVERISGRKKDPSTTQSQPVAAASNRQ